VNLSSKVKETRDKVLFWLKEESLSPQEIIDPNAYFNFGITSGDLKLNVVQNSMRIDSLFAATKWTLGKEQLDLHKNVLDDSKRIALYWDLMFIPLNNNLLGEYRISPNPPHDFKELFVSSIPIFYDGLTKCFLMHSIIAVQKAMIASVFLLEKHGGVLPPYPPIP
jgi:hypothetical protein